MAQLLADLVRFLVVESESGEADANDSFDDEVHLGDFMVFDVDHFVGVYSLVEVSRLKSLQTGVDKVVVYANSQTLHHVVTCTRLEYARILLHNVFVNVSANDVASYYIWQAVDLECAHGSHQQ